MLDDPNQDQAEASDKLFQLFRLLAVCHTIVVDKNAETGKINYLASSPDELALV